MSSTHGGETMWPIGEWRTSMAALGQSEGTVRDRVWAVSRFARLHPDPWAVTTADVEGALASWGSTPNYRRSVRSSLHMFYRWAIRAGLTLHDPTAAMDPIRQGRPRARACPERAITAAVMRADDDTRLMILLMYQCGLRCSEVAELRAGDVDGEWLTVLGKGRVRRRLALPPGLRRELARRQPVEGWLFPGRFDGHMRPASVGAKVKRALDAPGFSAHSLRHAFATRGYRETHDLLLIKEALGHASVATTEMYIDEDVEGLRRLAALFP